MQSHIFIVIGLFSECDQIEWTQNYINSVGSNQQRQMDPVGNLDCLEIVNNNIRSIPVGLVLLEYLRIRNIS